MRTGVLLVGLICVLSTREVAAQPWPMSVSDGWVVDGTLEPSEGFFFHQATGLSAGYTRKQAQTARCSAIAERVATVPAGSGTWTTAWISDLGEHGESLVLCRDYVETDWSPHAPHLFMLHVVKRGEDFDASSADTQAAVASLALALISSLDARYPAVVSQPAPSGVGVQAWVPSTVEQQVETPAPAPRPATKHDWGDTWKAQRPLRLAFGFWDTTLSDAAAMERHVSGNGVDLDYRSLDRPYQWTNPIDLHLRAGTSGDDLAVGMDRYRMEAWGTLGFATTPSQRIRGFGSMGAGVDWIYGDAAAMFVFGAGGSAYLARQVRLDANAGWNARTGPNSTRLSLALTVWRLSATVEVSSMGDVLTNQLAVGIDLLEGN